MDKKRLFIAVGLSFVLAMMVFLCNLDTSSAMECQIIRVNEAVVPPLAKIEPETLSISKGDCVVWFNGTREQQIKVIFEDGKKCSFFSQSSVGFNRDKECFTTSWIPTGLTASLRFMEKGTYEYVISLKNSALQLKGKIEVK